MTRNGIDFLMEPLRDSQAESNVDGEEVLLCRICGDKASGLHYGVYACEGCKGFFRRSINQKIQYRPCLRNQQCTITRVNRNRCQKCRLKKCVAVGMNRDAVRFGRVPKIEKLRMRKEVESANGWKRLQSIKEALNEEDNLTQTVVVAHYMTCELTRGRLQELLNRSYQQQSSVVQGTVACPLNPDPSSSTKFDRYSEKVTNQAQRVVDFAKRLPGFVHLCDEDQRTLLKSGSFEVLLIRMADLFNACPQSRRALVFTSGHLYFHDTVRISAGNSAAGNGGFMLDSMFDFAERFNALCLTDEEKALYSAVVFFSADRPGLRYPTHIQLIQNKLLEALHACTDTRNPELLSELITIVADLRTLNTIHTEKLFGLEKENPVVVDTAKALDELLPPTVWKAANDSGKSSTCSTPARLTNTSNRSEETDSDRKLVISGSPDTTSSSSKSVPTARLENSDLKRRSPQVVCQTSMGTFHRNSSPMNFAHLLQDQAAPVVKDERVDRVPTGDSPPSDGSPPKKFWKKRAIEQFQADICKEQQQPPPETQRCPVFLPPATHQSATELPFNPRLVSLTDFITGNPLHRTPPQLPLLQHVPPSPFGYRKLPTPQLSPIAAQLLHQLESVPGVGSQLLAEQYLTLLAGFQNSLSAPGAPRVWPPPPAPQCPPPQLR